MSTKPSDLSEITIKQSKKTVDRSIRTLLADMEHENTLVAETASGRLQRVLKIYRGIKPLLSVLGSLALLPQTWRAAIVLFNQALDALSLVGSEATAEFKAGKDL
jgi:hypothetical protein